MPRIRRALAPVLLAAAALACAFALERALACPIMAQPQTLRVLYQHSSRVVVADVGKSEVLATEGTMRFVRTSLDVKEDLKGSGERFVNFYHWEPGRDEFDGRSIILITSSLRIRPQLKQGERFLFFLERREAGDGFEVNDEGHGIKSLADDELKVYRERIKELAAITREGTEDKAAITEWLVRCAEEPATRWEGAYELERSAVAVRWEKAKAASAGTVEADKEGEASDEASAEEEAEEAGDEESAEESDEEEAEPEEEATPVATPDASATPTPPSLWRPLALRFTPPDPTLVPLLDAGQKRRLADALYGAREMGPGETALLHLVKDFGETAFPVFVISQLCRVEDDPPYEAGSWLHALASSLDNKELVAVAEAYARGQGFSVTDEAPADGVKPKEPESEEERAERFRVSVERAMRKRSASLKSALLQVERFLATGTVASK